MAFKKGNNLKLRIQILTLFIGLMFSSFINATQIEGDTNNENEQKSEEDNDDHVGFYSRFTLGFGIGTVMGQGTLDPLIGIERIDDPDYTTFDGSLQGDIGGGFKNIAIHMGVMYEKMILWDKYPTAMSYSFFGLGLGATWYFTPTDFYLTAQARYVRMLLRFPDVDFCDVECSDKNIWYRGPGVTVGLGKEWFGEDRNHKKDNGSIGIGLQGNYYKLYGGNINKAKFNYVSILFVMTLSKF